MFRSSLKWVLAAALLALSATPALADGPRGDRENAFRQTNLVSDIAGLAHTTDPNLKNPWGIATSATSPFWISDNGTGVSTLYNGNGTPQFQPTPLVVTIPPPTGKPAGTTAAPTGVVFNTTTSDFTVTAGSKSGKAFFIFATEDGTISGWNPTVDGTHAILAADHSSSAVYKGLALASGGGHSFLYATNFHDGTVDVFDAAFHQVHWAGAFRDPRLPAGFAPFGIQIIGSDLFVTYAKQNAEKHDDVAGPGNGFIDVFDTSGRLERRFASRGALNSPWGMVVAPSGFGPFGGDLLVGNFGDGRIHAFSMHEMHDDGDARGALKDEHHHDIVIDGLWGLRIGNGAAGGDASKVYFTAGLNDEADGLFGSLTAIDRNR